MSEHERRYEALVFDFDGTLVDSDAALVAAFVALGVAEERVTFGHAIGEELSLLGLTLDDYEDAYDTEVVEAFPGVADVVDRLGRWSLCSNKHPRSARRELERLAWTPEVAMFAEDFSWEHKRVGPVLEAMELTADQVALVGDSDGDLRCATEVGCDMIWAGWNPRVAAAEPAGRVLAHPEQLLDLYS